mmetsp:Transcript_109768/g.234545  ORF Transcript_109768/g.234545 Transcript_109768/m.234545 type:complete len:112 (-) Transcript_109768:106-441(-)
MRRALGLYTHQDRDLGSSGSVGRNIGTMLGDEEEEETEGRMSSVEATWVNLSPQTTDSAAQVLTFSFVKALTVAFSNVEVLVVTFSNVEALVVASSGEEAREMGRRNDETT